MTSDPVDVGRAEDSAAAPAALPPDSPGHSPAAPGEVRQRSRRGGYWLASLLLLAAVAAGAVLGAAGAVIYFDRQRLAPPPSPEEIVAAMLKRMDGHFTLAPEERERLEGIIRRRVERVGDIRRSTFAEIRGEFEAMREEVGECLGPDRFRVWDGAEQERWRRFREKAGSSPRGRPPGHWDGRR